MKTVYPPQTKFAGGITTITTILVWCKCSRQHRWLDISITNMNTSAGPVQVFQTCMPVGASLTDMTAG